MKADFPHSNTTTEIFKEISGVVIWKILRIVELKNNLNLSYRLGDDHTDHTPKIRTVV